MKEIFRNCLKSGVIGVGISMIFFVTFQGIPDKPYMIIINIAFGIVFGFAAGFLIGLGNTTAMHFFGPLISRFYDSLFIRILMYYLVSAAVFYGLVSLLEVVVPGFIPPPYGLYASLGVGIASVMVGLFFEYAEEKEEKIRLERAARELAIVEERNRIARELHDSVSQNLFGISLNLNTLQILLDKDPQKAGEIIAQLREMVCEVQAEMRLMIYELRPVNFKERGFFEALETMAGLFQNRYHLEVDCLLTGDETTIPVKTQIALYRVVQEALNNAARHAEATKVRVTLEITKHGAALTVSDNGRGFDPQTVDENLHYGLTGMRERLAAIGGRFTIDSAPDRGTVITARV